MTETAATTSIKINFTEARSAKAAIAEIKEAGGKWNAAPKVWTLTEADVPNWYASDRTEGMTKVEWVLHRATNFGRNTAAEVVR